MYKTLNTLYFDSEDFGGGSTPPPQNTEDWESRFKGLQRSSTQRERDLQTQVETLKSQLEGARGSLTSLQQRETELQSQLRAVTTQYEGKLAEMTSQLSEKDTALSTATKQVEDLSGKLTFADKDRKLRQTMSSDDYRDLLPFLDAGHLKHVIDLEGDDLTNALNSFRDLLGSRIQNNVRQTMTGTTPPPPQSVVTPTKGAAVDDLEVWVNNPANFNSPEYDTVYDQYLTKLSKP
jgi:uncharacterized phage infection (PIP) family protein YhgE